MAVHQPQFKLKCQKLPKVYAIQSTTRSVSHHCGYFQFSLYYGACWLAITPYKKLLITKQSMVAILAAKYPGKTPQLMGYLKTVEIIHGGGMGHLRLVL